jgi:hypothetical protein
MASALTFERSFAAENPVSKTEIVSTERTLARLVAEAFAADHPEIFADRRRAVPIMGSRASGPDVTSQAEQGFAAGESNAHIE